MRRHKVHLRYMGLGAACSPYIRTKLTDDLNLVTCKSCKATVSYKKRSGTE